MKTGLLLILLAATASGAAWAVDADPPSVKDPATAVLAESWALRLGEPPATATAEPQPAFADGNASAARRPQRMVYPGTVEAR